MPTPSPHWLIPDAPYDTYADYLSAVGAPALQRARSLHPDEVLAEVQRSGLRGRGGAGFPTGTKWGTLRNHDCERRFVVCNAAEGEPGTFKDRWLIRHNPYAVVEGMLIAAHVIGAKGLYIGLKESFEVEQARLRGAIDQMSDLIGTLQVTVVAGPEEYLFGEEKALLEVLSGGDPLPREAHQPPYEIGLFPTPLSPNPALVNNAETYAHVPDIIRHGAASFRTLGTADTPGTIIFTISGDVARPGVYEAEAGTSLATLFNERAGGPRPGRTFKAALSGVSSRVIEARRFGVAADFASLAMAGGGLGSAGFVVIDDAQPMPRVAQSVARFLYVESCNQCSACKQGLRIASQALDEIFDPEGATPDDVARALHGARIAPQGNRCYLPVQGSVVIPSLIETFRDEFDAQVQAPLPSEAFVVPKIVDFDPKTHTFTYDEDQPHKHPDWTYGPIEPARPVTRRTTPLLQPRDTASASTVVRLAPDVAKAFRDQDDVDTAVNVALRAWLSERGAL